MKTLGKKIRSANYLMLSTLLHSSALLAITLVPNYFPNMMGSNKPESETIEFTVATLDTKSPALAAPAAPEPVAPVVEVKEVKPKAADAPVVVKAPKAPKPVEPKTNEMPEKADEVGVKAVAAEETPIQEESPVEVAPPAEDLEKQKLEQQLADMEAAKQEQAAELEAAKKQHEEMLAAQEQEKSEAAKRALENAEALAAAEAAKLAAEEQAKVNAAEALAAKEAQATAAAEALAAQEALAAKEAEVAAAATAAAAAAEAKSKAAGGGGDMPNKIIVKQDYLQLKQMPGNTAPKYDDKMRLNKIQGRGQLVYFVTRDGTVRDVQLTKSTGHAELDNSALEAFKKYKFVPGQEGRTVHNFEFNLKGPAESASGRLRTSYQ